MDTRNYVTSTDLAQLAKLPRQRIVVGAKQLRKALAAETAQQVFLAGNADPNMTEPLEALCRDKQVPCVWISDMTQLGRACGIAVGAAAAAVII